jgi:hypothetical protein
VPTPFDRPVRRSVLLRCANHYAIEDCHPRPLNPSAKHLLVPSNNPIQTTTVLAPNKEKTGKIVKLDFTPTWKKQRANELRATFQTVSYATLKLARLVLHSARSMEIMRVASCRVLVCGNVIRSACMLARVVLEDSGEEWSGCGLPPYLCCLHIYILVLVTCEVTTTTAICGFGTRPVTIARWLTRAD